MNFREFTTPRDYLGDYYESFLQESTSGIYSETGLKNIFDQRFIPSKNENRMIVSSVIDGYEVHLSGATVTISESLFRMAVATESSRHMDSPLSSFATAQSPGSMACLSMDEHFILSFNDVEFNGPIFIKICGDYETMSHSALLMHFSNCGNVSMVEEHEIGGLTTAFLIYGITGDTQVDSYMLYKSSRGASDITSRRIHLHDGATFRATQCGMGASTVLDETVIHSYNDNDIDFAKYPIIGSGVDFSSLLTSIRSSEDTRVKVTEHILESGLSDTFISHSDNLSDMSQGDYGLTSTADMSPLETMAEAQNQIDRIVDRIPSELSMVDRFSRTFSEYTAMATRRLLG